MVEGSVLIDTGAFVALFDPTDQHHQLCSRQFQELPLGKAYACWPVMTEAAYLARRYPVQRDQLMEGVIAGDFSLLPLVESDLPGIIAILRKFNDQEIDLADATLVHLAQRENISTIFTLDRRHFTLFRQLNRQPFDLLPESLPPDSRRLPR